jgi:hypothetical protein
MAIKGAKAVQLRAQKLEIKVKIAYIKACQ